MATQLQLRRDTAVDLVSVTPVEAEPGYDQTNKRLLVGDGSRAEGIPHVSMFDAQNRPFTFVVAGGTANAITLDFTDGTLDYNPTAYAAGQKFAFKATADNTDSVTINVDGVGAVTAKKNAGADNLGAGDILNGGIYEISHDGTNFQFGAPGGGSGLSAPDFTSSEQSVSSNTVLDVAHGLSVVPKLYRVLLHCNNAELDFSAGDNVLFGGSYSDGTHGISFYADATNVSIATRSVRLIHGDGSATFSINNSKWRWIVEAWA